jgi:hypothetical protein
LEAIMVVCDYADGRTAAEQITISYRDKRFVVDLCAQHLRELTSKGRPPRRGRRPKTKTAVAPKRRGRPPGSKNKEKATKTREAGTTQTKGSTARTRKKS